MTIWAIVPVKPFLLGKSRLSGVLSTEERALLNRMMLERTLGVLKNSPEIATTIVVSRDPEVLAVAREFDVRTLMEHGQTQNDLNLALTRASAMARTFAIKSMLILPADLPLLAREDISAMVANSKEDGVVAIAPDRRNDGTNAMFINPTGLIEFEYGPQSFGKHCAQAVNANTKLEIVRRVSLGLDLDYPEDLELYNQIITQKEMP